MARKKAAQERLSCGYVRVSSEDQVREGVSLDAQRERLRAYGIATGRGIAAMYSDEGASGKSLDRPAMIRLIDDCREGRIECVMVLKLDRLTRSVRDLGELLDVFNRSGVALVSATEALDTSTAGGRLMLNLLASVSQWEREAIAERTSFALAYKRRNRQAYAPTPFGFKRHGSVLIVDDEQQAALQTMRLMRRNGATYQEIADALQRAAIKPRGKRWYPASVRAILGSLMTNEVAGTAASGCPTMTSP